MTYAAFVELRTQGGMILLVRNARHPDVWMLPGGLAEPDDMSPGHTARRELQEETGLGLPVWRVIPNGWSVGDIPDEAAILFWNFVSATGDEAVAVTPREGEILACQWFAPESVGKLDMYPATATYLQRLRGTA